MMVSSEVWVPFVDRGGLMGFEILQWELGDEDRYEILTITSDEKWTPRRYLEEPEYQDKNSSESDNDWDIFATQNDDDDFHDAQQDGDLSLHVFLDIIEDVTFEDALEGSSVAPND